MCPNELQGLPCGPRSIQRRMFPIRNEVDLGFHAIQLVVLPYQHLANDRRYDLVFVLSDGRVSSCTCFIDVRLQATEPNLQVPRFFLYGMTGRGAGHRGTYGLKMHGLTEIGCVVPASTASYASYKTHYLRSSKTFAVRLLNCFSCLALPLYRRSNAALSRKHFWKQFLEMCCASGFANSVNPMCASKPLYHCLRADGGISYQDLRKPSFLSNTVCMRKLKAFHSLQRGPPTRWL